jgi:hypothetical protein
MVACTQVCPRKSRLTRPARFSAPQAHALAKQANLRRAPLLGPLRQARRISNKLRQTSRPKASRDKHDAKPLASAPNYSTGSARVLRNNVQLKAIGKAPGASRYSKQSAAVRQIVHRAWNVANAEIDCPSLQYTLAGDGAALIHVRKRACNHRRERKSHQSHTRLLLGIVSLFQ